MQSSPYLARILRATKISPISKTETSTQYQDYLKNKPSGKHPAGKKPSENYDKRFVDLVEKEMRK